MRVSLIIPNRNNARYLRQCLESAQAQTRKFDEIIVVDDASSDESVALMRSIATGCSKMRLIELEQQVGVAVARDIAIRAATGTHLSTLDSDDFYWSPKKNENECAMIEACGQAAALVAFSDIQWVDEHGASLGSMASKRRVSEGAVFYSLLLLKGLIPRDFTFPRDAYFRAGGYDTSLRLYEDWDLKLRLARLCGFRYTGKDGVAYRRSGSGLSSAGLGLHLRCMHTIVLKNTLALPLPRRCAVRMAAHMATLWFHRGRLKTMLLKS